EGSGRQELSSQKLLELFTKMNQLVGLRVIALTNKKFDFDQVQEAERFIHFVIPRSLKGEWLMGLGLDTTLKFKVGDATYVLEIGRTLDEIIALKEGVGIKELIGLVMRVIRETYEVDAQLI